VNSLVYLGQTKLKRAFPSQPFDLLALLLSRSCLLTPTFPCGTASLFLQYLRSFIRPCVPRSLSLSPATTTLL